jgi:hypothetical protein
MKMYKVPTCACYSSVTLMLKNFMKRNYVPSELPNDLNFKELCGLLTVTACTIICEELL